MMTKDKYQNLSSDEISLMLFNDGEYIATRVSYGYKLKLYALYGFYIEVSFHPFSHNIEKVEVLESKKMLDLYLPDVDFGKLITVR